MVFHLCKLIPRSHPLLLRTSVRVEYRPPTWVALSYLHPISKCNHILRSWRLRSEQTNFGGTENFAHNTPRPLDLSGTLRTKNAKRKIAPYAGCNAFFKVQNLQVLVKKGNNAAIAWPFRSNYVNIRKYQHG